MVKLPVKQTVYADFLYNQVEQLLNREGGFTLARLSEVSGLRITGNMRRRLQHCVVAGTLEARPAWKGGDGRCPMVYSRTEQGYKEFPF